MFKSVEKYLLRIRGGDYNDVVKVLVGIRKCRKTIILNQIIEELKNKAMALENVGYNELLCRGYLVQIGKTKKGEVDFIVIKENKKIYIQLCYY